ncbi:hypothetical protein ACVST0_11620 [Yersinia enterocolitica]
MTNSQIKSVINFLFFTWFAGAGIVVAIMGEALSYSIPMISVGGLFFWASMRKN